MSHQAHDLGTAEGLATHALIVLVQVPALLRDKGPYIKIDIGRAVDELTVGQEVEGWAGGDLGGGNAQRLPRLQGVGIGQAVGVDEGLQTAAKALRNAA
jgi:hypothetical protein